MDSGKPFDHERDPGPAGALAQLRQVVPPPSLVAGVMQRVGEPRPPSLWRWLRRPFVIQLRLSPLGAGGFALGLACTFAAVLTVRSSFTPTRGVAPVEVAATSAVAPGASPASAPVRVRFRLNARGAKRVSLVGSFNQWSAGQTTLEPVSDGGSFAGTVELAPGTYEYMFVVDGKWVTDPAADELRDDGFGRRNALLRL